ncbi:MAG TPA: multicopper oxidase domain-containing protein [Candidatus Limnocylindrales bacterium]|nr:multicopper oxidase domain-containing protein [Candidatus Limnocylindrales bacterium]
MEPQPQASLHPSTLIDAALTRRGFLRGAAVTGGGLIAATLAACAPAAAAPGWTYPPSTPIPAAPSNSVDCAIPSASAAATTAPTMSGMPMASGSPAASASGGAVPAGWTQHDVTARLGIRRYIGNLAPALKDVYGDAAFAKLVDVLGATETYPELQKKPSFVQVPQLNLNDALKPLTPQIDGGVKVFKLTIDEIQQQIDEIKAPVAALGYNGQWPGPTIKVTQGDRVRVVVTNNLKETTGVHFHGVLFQDFFEDGVPFITQKPITPGETYTYEFTASNAGSLMYHSHHNATDQVGRGLLGAFIVEPKTGGLKSDRDFIWISNDSLGGFTINGHGFPAVQPILAAKGETVRIRFMNEGIMMHPWHLHGNIMKVVERDGRPLGTAAFECDTLGVNPGERYDVLVKADTPGIWAFHCHILPHVEGMEGMFGMVSTLIVVPEKAHVDAIESLLLAA